MLGLVLKSRHVGLKSLLTRVLPIQCVTLPTKSATSSSCRLFTQVRGFPWKYGTANRGIHSESPSVQFDASTVYALSSGTGRAGVAVIRISGPDSFPVLRRLLGKKQSIPATRKACTRRLLHPNTFELLDRAMVLVFEGPKSFTGENVVELHVHGGPSVVAGIFSALQTLHGKYDIGSASAGDFTRRAFANGKMDLTAVEGVADLLEAETELQRRQALRQMEGELENLYEGWRSNLIDCLAYTEAVIDFSDDETTDDVDESAFIEILPKVKEIRDTIMNYLKDRNRGEILRSGAQVALIGPPNAGKSSLLNVLARRSAAIVSPFAGTTRDIVEVSFIESNFDLFFYAF